MELIRIKKNMQLKEAALLKEYGTKIMKTKSVYKTITIYSKTILPLDYGMLSIHQVQSQLLVSEMISKTCCYQ